MKNIIKYIKLFIVILVFVLSLFAFKSRTSYGIYRQTLSTSFTLTVSNPSTTFTITFDTHGGSGVATETRTYNEPFGSVSESELAGYNFLGWFDGTGDSAVQYRPDTPITGNITVHAKFEKIVCMKAAVGTLHSEKCESQSNSEGCRGAGIQYDTYFDYGAIPGANTYLAGDAYDCDVNDDGTYDPIGERFYLIRKNEDNDSMALVYYTSIDESGPVDTQSRAGSSLTYEASTVYLPQTTSLSTNDQWDNSKLLTFSGVGYSNKVSRYINMNDLEAACGTFSSSNGYLDSCYFFMENSRFQSGNTGSNLKGRAGIWLQATEISSSGGQRIHTSTRAVTTVNTNSNGSTNTSRPVIEIPVTTIEDFPVRYKYTATFETDGGSSVSPITKYAGEKLGTLEEPTRNGYDFLGWYTENVNWSTQIDANTVMPSQDVIYYAKWIANIDNMEYVFRIQGQCNFNGEYVDSNTTNYITSDNDTCISEDKDGNTFNWATANKNYIDTGIPLFNSTNFDKDFEIGFTIDYYNKNSQGNNNSQATFLNAKLDNQSMNYPGLVVRRNDPGIQLTEKFNGTTATQPFTYTAGMKVKVVRRNNRIWYAIDDDPLTEFQNITGFNQYFELYTWFGAYAFETSTSADGTNSTAGRYVVAKLSNMYIKLERSQPANTYVVHFISDGGSMDYTSTRYVPYNDPIGTLPTITRQHYTFDGWFTQNGQTPITSSYVVSSDVNLYAHFTPDSYTITYDNAGGIPANYTDTKSFNERLESLPQAPTKAHYTFGGWYTDNVNYTEQVTTQTVVTGTVTYYAKWIPDVQTITFDSQGGTPASYTASVNYGEAIGASNMPSPNPTKADCLFGGWYTDNVNFTTAVDENTIVYGNDVYYARWLQGSSLSVTFHLQDGDPLPNNPIYYAYGDLLGTLPTPTKTYYLFDGWYSDSDLTVAVSSTTPVYSDMDLYAKWVLDPAYVARIGTTYYETLALAIEAVPQNTQTTIVMVQDVTLPATAEIPSSRNIILDMNGHEIEYTGGNVIKVLNGGTLTYRDSDGGGVLTGGKVNGSTQIPALLNVSGGTVYIESGNITSNITNVIENNGNMTISGGSITIGNVTQGIINNYAGGVLNITGGEIVASVAGSKRQAVYNKGTVNISGNAYLYSNSTDRATLQNDASGAVINITSGTIISNNANCQRGAIQNIANATVTIAGGTVTSNSTYTGTASGSGPGAIQNAGNLIIGNNSDGVYDVTSPVIIAKRHGINTSNVSNTYMYDGIIKSKDATIKNNLSIPSANTMAGTSKVTGTESIDGVPYNTLYYEVVSGYTVTFDPGSGQVERDTMKFPENSTVTNLPTATWAGHIFDGWYTPQDVLVVEGVTVVSQDITYTAKWVDSVLQANMTNSTMTITRNATGSIGVTNTNTIEPFTYASNDTSIATVNSSGVVTGVSPGITQITMTGDISGDVVQSIVTVDYANDIPTFDIMSSAMRTYFNNIDIWADGQTDSNHSSYDSYMSSNLSTNNCVNFNGDDRVNNSTGSVYCDQPNEYDTHVSGSVNLYEYNPATNTVTGDALYATVNNGKIYNLIPGKAYYWENANDSTDNGKFYAFGERRIIKIDNLKAGSSSTFYQTRNVRDLGGIKVTYTDANNQTVNGTIKYGKLFRGEKIWGGNGDSIQYFTKLGINHEMDLRANSEPVTNEEDSFANAYKIVTNDNPTNYKTYEIIHYGIDYDDNRSNYNLARSAVVKVMQEFNADPTYSLYFHCRIGADRTGTLAYLLEGLLGVSEEDRYRDYEMTVFFGLDERTRFYYNKGSNTTKFVYMKQAIRNASTNNDENVLEWFLKGSTNQAADMALVQQFRSNMVE